MKLERHIAVAIGDGLEASSTALHGRQCEAGVVLRTNGHDACHLGRRPAGPRGTTPRVEIASFVLSRRTLGTVAVGQPRHPWLSALLLCSVECSGRGP